jgi:hypothetical protein
MDTSLKNILITMTISRWLKILPMLVLPVFLIGCEGPASEANPFQDDGGEVSQSPPARDEQVRAFQTNLWANLNAENRCGQCHSSQSSAPQEPMFADVSDVNASYDALVGYTPTLVKLDDPSGSFLVEKVGADHNCWEQFSSVCADSIENMITAWAGGSTDSASAREIKLTAPQIKSPGDSKTFPASAADNDADSFANALHPLLVERCIGCHYEEAVTQQQSPFFANPDVDSAYEAVKPKINIDLPIDSRLVQRLLENHNCWSDCGSYDETTGVTTGNAGEMLAAIEQFASGIVPTEIDPNLITSKALVLLIDGIVASGGNRHEANQVALWEFKVGTGNTAFDTSGIEPAMNLTLEGDYEWVGGYGVDFSGGKGQADTTNSKKLHDLIKLTGEYSIEAWVIPANVTQEDANIISYDSGAVSKNFALSQTLYNYNFHNRSDQSDANGEPTLATPDADEVLQSSLQHVVATYDPIEGRKLYVNGEMINAADPIAVSTSIASWDPSFAFVLGQSAANSKIWQGKIRMAAMHNEALSVEQVKQNFDVGVGQKYFLLFSVSDQTGIDGCLKDAETEGDPQIHQCFIRFEVSQFDSYSYLFDKPTFINLDTAWTPASSFSIRKMRIGINGKEAVAGQSFGYMDATVDAANYDTAAGQELSSHGAVIALEKGADSDEFFLTFEFLAGASNPHIDPDPTPPATPADSDPVSDIGVRTFDEINATIARMTGIPVTNAKINALFLQYKQQLPTVESIDAFLSSHQMAIAQLALTSCSERVDADAALPVGDSGRGLFKDFDFGISSGAAFDTQAERDLLINPLLDAVLSQNLASQPDHADVASLLGGMSSQTLTGPNGDPLVDPDGDFSNPAYPSLITQLNTINSTARTAQIAKAVCAAAVGSAAMLIQ